MNLSAGHFQTQLDNEENPNIDSVAVLEWTPLTSIYKRLHVAMRSMIITHELINGRLPGSVKTKRVHANEAFGNEEKF